MEAERTSRENSAYDFQRFMLPIPKKLHSLPGQSFRKDKGISYNKSGEEETSTHRVRKCFRKGTQINSHFCCSFTPCPHLY
jgi:hypothetical protein